MDIERRFSEAPRIETRADGKPMIVGYAAVFYDGTPGTEFDLRSDGTVFERIMPSATFPPLQSRGLIALFNHDPSMILGRESSGTLRVKVDKRGLGYEIDPPDTQLGRDTQELIRRGDIFGSSFSFKAGKDDQEFAREQRSGRGVVVRRLSRMNVLDVGPVTFSSYGSADVDIARRMLDVFEKESIPWRRENARRRQEITESLLTNG